MALADLQVLYTVYHLLCKYQYLTTELQFYKLIKAQVKYVSQELVSVVLGLCKTLKHLASNVSICCVKKIHLQARRVSMCGLQQRCFLISSDGFGRFPANLPFV